jgi:hypothetical protein
LAELRSAPQLFAKRGCVDDDLVEIDHLGEMASL